MKNHVYLRNDCLDRAQDAIRQIRTEKTPSVLVFSAAREWIRRAEFAHLNDGQILESQFVDVAEYLDSIK